MKKIKKQTAFLIFLLANLTLGLFSQTLPEGNSQESGSGSKNENGAVFSTESLNTKGKKTYTKVTQGHKIPENRKSVALVLGGGGARGFVHVPLVQAILDEGIPIDLIIGTSAGALIGGFYSAGYTEAELLPELRKIDWYQIFKDSPPDLYARYMQNRVGDPYPIKVTTDDKFNLSMGTGVFTGQLVFDTIKSLLVKIPSNIDFDSLPIPFRAVAADIMAGEKVVLSAGDLPEAMRSSMSLPGIFEPFEIDGKILVDGTVIDNVPVKTAKDMGYDVIIVVDISVPPISDANELRTTPFSSLNQAMNIFQTKKNREEAKLADLIIYPDLENYSTVDYTKMEEIFLVGEKAAKDYKNELKKLKDYIYGKEYTDTSPYKNREFSYERISDMEYLTFENLNVKGVLSPDLPFVEKLFNSVKGKPFTKLEYETVSREIFNTGNYSLVNISVEKNQAGNTLLIETKAKPKEGFTINFGFNYGNTISNNLYSNLDVVQNFSFKDITNKGSEISLSAILIDTFGFQFNYLQPFGHYIFMEMDASYLDRQDVLSYATNSPLIISQRNQQAGGSILLGATLNSQNWFSISARAGWVNTFQEDREIQETIFADTYIAFDAKYTLDTLNSSVFPTKGIRIDISGSLIKTLNNINKAPFAKKLNLKLISAIPFNSEVSAGIHINFGTEQEEIISRMSPVNFLEAFSLCNRDIFPQIPQRDIYGNHILSVKGDIKFNPFGYLTALGGKFFLIGEGAWGCLWDKIEKMSPVEQEWNTDIGAGLEITPTFGIRARVGVGSFRKSIRPYLAIDFGNFMN